MAVTSEVDGKQQVWDPINKRWLETMWDERTGKWLPIPWQKLWAEMVNIAEEKQKKIEALTLAVQNADGEKDCQPCQSCPFDWLIKEKCPIRYKNFVGATSAADCVVKFYKNGFFRECVRDNKDMK